MCRTCGTVLSEHLTNYTVVRRGKCALVFYALPYRPLRYPAECGEIDAYYFASNRAYHYSASVAARLREAGFSARHRVEGDYKRLLAGRGGMGRAVNTLCFMEGLGSRFVVGALEVEADLPETPIAALRECLRCGACIAACPQNALEGGVFRRERCLRQIMESGEFFDDGVSERMGSRVLGCDACQRACPLNADVGEEPAGEELSRITSFPALLALLAEGRVKTLAPLIGANYARAGRLAGLAVNAAGNCGTAECIEPIERVLAAGLADSRNAARAMRKIREREV